MVLMGLMLAWSSGGIERLTVIDLLVINGSRSGARFALPDEPIVVGRSPEAHVRIDDPWISNMHALFEPRRGGLWVVDLGSRNGTFLDDERISEARVVAGMALAFGKTRVEVRDRTAASAGESEPILTPIRTEPMSATAPHVRSRPTTGKRRK
jgi:pSer/pThr/pTyr-binding forkhead associated (FHA) protein